MTTRVDLKPLQEYGMEAVVNLDPENLLPKQVRSAEIVVDVEEEETLDRTIMSTVASASKVLNKMGVKFEEMDFTTDMFPEEQRAWADQVLEATLEQMHKAIEEGRW